jgi:hypothetical protein
LRNGIKTFVLYSITDSELLADPMALLYNRNINNKNISDKSDKYILSIVLAIGEKHKQEK